MGFRKTIYVPNYGTEQNYASMHEAHDGEKCQVARYVLAQVYTVRPTLTIKPVKSGKKSKK